MPKDRLAPGTTIHTMGYPLRNEEFGGGFIYSMPDGLVSLGFVMGLDYRDPLFDPHQRFKNSSSIRFIADPAQAGKLVRYGAKALPEGGWHTVPRVTRTAPSSRAMRADSSTRCGSREFTWRCGPACWRRKRRSQSIRAATRVGADVARYEERIDNSDVRRELYPVRNVHQSFSHGLLPGSCIPASRWSPAAGGYRSDARRTPGTSAWRSWTATTPQPPDVGLPARPAKIDRQLTFDKLTNVHYSGTRHPEDQPSHLIVHDTDICRTRCREEYGNPCTRFCPANVYEMVDAGDGTKKLQINASNCVHCKTCDIMDPYQIIDWVPPEGGGGPQYEGM